MVTILLDSSSTNLVVGLSCDGQLIDSLCYEAWQRQSELMIKELDNMLFKHHYTKNDINAVVTTVGPGSYTGVRISVTIAKVMGLALNIPIYTLSSLQILKDGNKPSICVMNARANRSYVGVYDDNKVVLKDQIMDNDTLINYINQHSDYSLCGNTEYLKMNSVSCDIFKNMIDLIKTTKPAADILSIKPVYLKG